MTPAKQEAMALIGKLPDDTDLEEIMYRLRVLEKVRKGQEDADRGAVIGSTE